MAIITGISGLDTVMANLNKEIRQIENRSAKGLIEAAALIRRDTEKSPPLTPVDLGNLRASWFCATASGTTSDPSGESGNFKRGRKGRSHRSQSFISRMRKDYGAVKSQSISEARGLENSEKGKFVVTGYSAFYAAPVHEMMERNPGVVWSRPGSGGKWFQAAIYRNRDNIVKIIRENAKLKK